MAWRRKIGTIFDIHPGEGPLVFLFIVHYALLGLGNVCAVTLSFPLYLATFGQAALPWAYIATAVLVSVVGAIYLKLAEKIRLSRLLILTLVFLLLGCLIIRGGLELNQVDWLIFILPGWYLVIVNFGNISVWNLAGRIFDVRQGKRLFGLVGSGRWLGYMAAAPVVPLLVGLGGTKNLYIMAAVFLGLSLFVQLLILRKSPGPVDIQPEKKPAVTAQKTAARSQNKYLWLIYAFFFAWALAFYINEQLYFVSSDRQFSSPEDLASFLAIIAGIVGVITFFSNLFLVARVLEKFGLRYNLGLVPVVTVIVSLLVVVVSLAAGENSLVFWLITLLYSLNFSQSFSLQSSGLRVAFQPLTPAQLVRAQTVSESIIEPLAICLSGAVALLINLVFGTGVLPLTILLGLLGLAFLVFSLLLSREYTAALSQALTRRRLGTQSFYTPDKTSLAILQKYLQDPYPGAVVYSLELLEQIEPERLAGVLPDLLRHPAPEVRREALRRIEQRPMVEAQAEVQSLLAAEKDPAVIAPAIKVLLALDPAGNNAKILPFLKNSDPAIRQAALTALLTLKTTASPGLAAQELQRLAGSALAEERLLAAVILGEPGLAKFANLLPGLMRDSEVKVRKSALEAAGKSGQPDLLAAAVAMLAELPVQSAAANALTSAGQATLPVIRAAFEKPGQSPEVLSSLARVLGRIKLEAAANLLQNYLDWPQEQVRTQVLRSLNACGYQAAAAAAEKVRRQLKAEATMTVPLLAAQYDLTRSGEPANPEHQLLVSALQAAIRQSQERLFLLLSFIHDSRKANLAREAFFSGLSGKQAYAVEMVDTLMTAPSDLKHLTLALLEDHSPAERLKRLANFASQPSLDLPARLETILTGSPPDQESWVKACAIFLATGLAAPVCLPIIRQLAAAPVPLVAGEAASAIARLDRQNLPDLTTKKGSRFMFSTIEKVIILKSTSIFSATPEPVLAEVAALLEETEIAPGTAVFQKGEPGNSMYIIVSGRVKVYDGQNVLAYLEERQVFGELSLLDSETRSASIEAVTDCLLFRLDQEAFFDLMADQPEVMRGILKVVTGYVRARTQDVTDLKIRVRELETAR